MTRVTFISVENRRTLYKKTLVSILLYGVCILLYGVYHCMEYIIVQLTIDDPQPLMMVLTDYIDR